MECTLAATAPATAPALVVAPPSLLAAFAAVPDPRRQASVAYPLPALLALAVVAILARQLSQLAIAEWAAAAGRGGAGPLGLAGQAGRPASRRCSGSSPGSTPTGWSTPCGAHFQPPGRARPGGARRAGRRHRRQGAARAAALPGRAAARSMRSPPSATSRASSWRRSRSTRGADKAEAELTVAPALLARLDWRGRVLTGDALFCQRACAAQVLRGRGRLPAGGPRRTSPPSTATSPCSSTRPRRRRPRRSATAARPPPWSAGHGRTHDRRHLVASDRPEPLPRLAGGGPGLPPGAAPGASGARTKRQVHYGITSLPPAVADPARLLALNAATGRSRMGCTNRRTSASARTPACPPRRRADRDGAPARRRPQPAAPRRPPRHRPPLRAHADQPARRRRPRLSPPPHSRISPAPSHHALARRCRSGSRLGWVRCSRWRSNSAKRWW